MNQNLIELEAVAMQLNEIRQNPKYKRKFPKTIWGNIFELIKALSLAKVCNYLNLDPGYVKKKFKTQHSLMSSKNLKFQEVFIAPAEQERVVVELFHFDLKAKIEGPISCIKELKALFKEN